MRSPCQQLRETPLPASGKAAGDSSFDHLAKNGEDIPKPVIYRLSIYLRCLTQLRDEGRHTLSSEALAEYAGVKSTQLRKDLAYFGQFGTRGLGYNVTQLTTIVGRVLGTKKSRSVVLIGVGNLGLALLSYQGFRREGFHINAAFDLVPQKPRNKFITQPVFPMSFVSHYIQSNRIRIAILCTPPGAAQNTAALLIRHGITGILNFAPTVLQVPDHVTVNNVDLAIELENLSYFIQKKTFTESVR